MKIEIEISEENAACLWADNHKRQTVESIAQGLVEAAGHRYRRAFGDAAVKTAITEYRDAKEVK